MSRLVRQARRETLDRRGRKETKAIRALKAHKVLKEILVQQGRLVQLEKVLKLCR